MKSSELSDKNTVYNKKKKKSDTKLFLKQRRWLCRFLLRNIAFSFLARVDQVNAMDRIPKKGPAILMINHIAFIDPLILVHLVQRDVVPLAKEEVYNYPLVGIFPKLWGVIPVRRGLVDRQSIQSALRHLREGEIVLVAPEGTRNAALKRGLEGAAYLASRSGAPIIPTAIVGSDGFPTTPFSKRWKEPGVHVRFGEPILYKKTYRRARGEDLRKMMDEAMYLLAELLPPERRGFFSDISKATRDTID